MEELGRKMVKHCWGLPLAITVLGGVLATKNSSEWHIVFETIKSCLKRGEGHGQQQLGVSYGVLTLSYDDLPSELKPCFLYLSLFPEDSEIDVDKLIQLWVAEGFITSEQHNSENGVERMEDVACRYLNDLVKRCMVLVGDTRLRITCRMHDLMRDLCLSKAKEENFLRIVDRGNRDENVDSFPSSSSGKIRRLAIYLPQCCNEGLLKLIKNPHLRSLLCLCEVHPCQEWLEMPDFNNLKLIRVLNVDGEHAWRLKLKLPKDIGKLIHLRYLSLNANVSELPSSLGNLRYLQTLNLRVMNRVQVPNVLWKMECLRHLYLPEKCDDKSKLRLGNLRSLQTLVNFSFKNFNISELLNNMTNLRELSLQHLYLIRNFGETFKSRGITLQHLRSLRLDNWDGIDVDVEVEKIDVCPFISSCINLNELKIIGPIEKLPDSDQLSASIIDIYLCKTRLEEDQMTTLEKLPNLRNLTLSKDALMGKQLFFPREGFSRLHSLNLWMQDNLEEWRVDEGALPNLCHLEIRGCSKLKTFPDGLRFVRTLKALEITWMPNEFKDRLVEGGEDFYKVQHVPSLRFIG